MWKCYLNRSSWRFVISTGQSKPASLIACSVLPSGISRSTLSTKTISSVSWICWIDRWTWILVPWCVTSNLVRVIHSLLGQEERWSCVCRLVRCLFEFTLLQLYRILDVHLVLYSCARGQGWLNRTERTIFHWSINRDLKRVISITRHRVAIRFESVFYIIL
jgi:hypothetical protein